MAGNLEKMCASSSSFSDFQFGPKKSKMLKQDLKFALQGLRWMTFLGGELSFTLDIILRRQIIWLAFFSDV